MDKRPTGAELITNERLRQIVVEGWTLKHDAAHINGELGLVAVCYILHAIFGFSNNYKKSWPGVWWPVTWNKKWWKPKDRIRDLTKAGALIAAEIDRLQRIKSTEIEIAEILNRGVEKGDTK